MRRCREESWFCCLSLSLVPLKSFPIHHPTNKRLDVPSREPAGRGGGGAEEGGDESSLLDPRGRTGSIFFSPLASSFRFIKRRKSSPLGSACRSPPRPCPQTRSKGRSFAPLTRERGQPEHQKREQKLQRQLLLMRRR